MDMHVRVFAIGGNWSIANMTSTGDCFVGNASDLTTLNSLIDLVELKRGYAVSLHGNIGDETISGEMLLADARAWVRSSWVMDPCSIARIASSRAN